MPVKKFEDQLDKAFDFNYKIYSKNKVFSLETFGITMTLFHYYTYFKSLSEFDKSKVIIACIFLSAKIKGRFFKLEDLKKIYQENSERNNSEISDKEIINFEIELLTFLGFEIDLETPFSYLERILDTMDFSLVLKQRSTDSTNDFTEKTQISINNPPQINNTEKIINISNSKSINTHINNNCNNSNNNNKNCDSNSQDPGTPLRMTKVIEVNKLNNESNPQLNVLNKNYFNKLSKEEIIEKVRFLAFNYLIDTYRRPFCITFKCKCIALCSFLMAFNFLVENCNSDYYLDNKYFFDNFYKEGDYKDFLICYSEIIKLFN